MMYGFRGLWMLPMMLFCIVLIVLVVVFLIKYFNKTNVPYVDRRAIDILNEKLASGEISEEEYQRKKQMINGR